MNFWDTDEVAADRKMSAFIVDRDTFPRFDIRRFAIVSYWLESGIATALASHAGFVDEACD